MGLAHDLRFGWRLLVRQRAFAAVVVLTLGTGIGAATAVFTLVHAVVLRALPFTEPDRLVWMYNARTERDRAPFSIPDLDDYRRDASSIVGLATFTNWTANLTGAGEPERLEGTRVAGNFFELVGASALVGRTLQPADEAASAKVAVLTYGLWSRRFGRDPTIVGRSIILNGAAHIVVGILPPDFLFPFRDAQVAVPLALQSDPRRTDRGANFLRVVARIRSDVTIAQAKADLDTIARRLQRAFPDDDARKIGVNLYPLHAEIVSDYRQILWTLLAAVVVLVAIGCGNLANLLLVRASARRTELAVRRSLGASRARIARQLAIEACLLVMLALCSGVALAYWAVAAWHAFGPSSFPRMSAVAIDGPVVAGAVLVSTIVALVCAVLPAWAVTRDLAGGIGETTRSLASSRRHGTIRRAFVTVQVAGCTVLLVCMGLVAKGFGRLSSVEPGFAPHHALTVQLSLPPARYSTREAIVRFYDALSVSLADIPGTRSVGTASLLPLSGLLNTMDVSFPDRPAPPPDQVPQAHFRIASPGYFAATGVRLLAGREFGPHDRADSQPVAIVSRSFADRHWPGEDATGKHVRLGSAEHSLEIVGVVNDVKQFALDGPTTADLYIPVYQMPASQVSALVARMNWVIRTAGDPRQHEAAVRRAVASIDPDVASSSVRTLDAVLSASLASRRLNVQLLGVFGQVGVMLAAIGVYAIAAFSAAARRRELAIRAVCGAGRHALAALVFCQELPPVVLGLATGVVIAAALARDLVGALFDVNPWDPSIHFAVTIGLFLVALGATYLPARRAGLVDPSELLRS